MAGRDAVLDFPEQRAVLGAVGGLALNQAVEIRGDLVVEAEKGEGGEGFVPFGRQFAGCAEL